MYCRTKWDFGTEGKKEGQAVEEESNEEGYINLGRMVGASAVRGMLTVSVLYANGYRY